MQWWGISNDDAEEENILQCICCFMYFSREKNQEGGRERKIFMRHKSHRQFKRSQAKVKWEWQ